MLNVRKIVNNVLMNGSHARKDDGGKPGLIFVGGTTRMINGSYAYTATIVTRCWGLLSRWVDLLGDASELFFVAMWREIILLRPTGTKHEMIPSLKLNVCSFSEGGSDAIELKALSCS